MTTRTYKGVEIREEKGKYFVTDLKHNYYEHNPHSMRDAKRLIEFMLWLKEDEAKG